MKDLCRPLFSSNGRPIKIRPARKPRCNPHRVNSQTNKRARPPPLSPPGVERERRATKIPLAAITTPRRPVIGRPADRIGKPNRQRGNAVDAVFLVSAYAKPLAAAVHRGQPPWSLNNACDIRATKRCDAPGVPKVAATIPAFSRYFIYPLIYLFLSLFFFLSIYFFYPLLSASMDS